MIDLAPHPLVEPAPGGLCWKRSDRRRPGRGPEAHRELVVLLGLAGHARYLMDGAVHDLGRGSILWAFAGQVHVLLSDSPDFDMWVFLISGRVLQENESPSLPPLNLPASGGVSPRQLDIKATRALSEIAEFIRSEPCAIARRIGLRWWLLRAWGHWQSAAEAKTHAVHPAVERAARLLRAEPEVSMPRLAQAAGLSQSRLSQLFRKQIGTGLVEFRTDQKLERVDSLMRTKRTTLTASALEAGFGSYSQFFRAFHARRGISPKRFYGQK